MGNQQRKAIIIYDEQVCEDKKKSGTCKKIRTPEEIEMNRLYELLVYWGYDSPSLADVLRLRAQIVRAQKRLRREFHAKGSVGPEPTFDDTVTLVKSERDKRNVLLMKTNNEQKRAEEQQRKIAELSRREKYLKSKDKSKWGKECERKREIEKTYEDTASLTWSSDLEARKKRQKIMNREIGYTGGDKCTDDAHCVWDKLTMKDDPTYKKYFWLLEQGHTKESVRKMMPAKLDPSVLDFPDKLAPERYIDRFQKSDGEVATVVPDCKKDENGKFQPLRSDENEEGLRQCFSYMKCRGKTLKDFTEEYLNGLLLPKYRNCEFVETQHATKDKDENNKYFTKLPPANKDPKYAKYFKLFHGLGSKITRKIMENENNTKYFPMLDLSKEKTERKINVEKIVDPNYIRYFWMIHGFPKERVQLMLFDNGLDPGVLDNPKMPARDAGYTELKMTTIGAGKPKKRCWLTMKEIVEGQDKLSKALGTDKVWWVEAVVQRYGPFALLDDDHNTALHYLMLWGPEDQTAENVKAIEYIAEHSDNFIKGAQAKNVHGETPLDIAIRVKGKKSKETRTIVEILQIKGDEETKRKVKRKKNLISKILKLGKGIRNYETKYGGVLHKERSMYNHFASKHDLPNYTI